MVLHTIRYKIHVYSQLMRTKVCLITIFGIIIGALISGNLIFGIGSVIPFAVALVAGFVITGAGNTINDYYDYEIDRISDVAEIRERPLPSGKLKLREALIFSLLLALAGAILAFNVSTAFFYIALFNIFVAFAYAKFLKPVALLKNIGVAWLGASAFLAGSLIGSPVIELPIGVLALVAFLTTMSWEMLKDIRDMKNDTVNQVHTIPYYIGEKRTKIFSYLLIAGAYGILLLSYEIFGLVYLTGVVPAIAVSLYSIKLSVRKAYKMIRISTWLVILGLLLSVLV